MHPSTIIGIFLILVTSLTIYLMPAPHPHERTCPEGYVAIGSRTGNYCVVGYVSP